MSPPPCRYGNFLFPTRRCGGILPGMAFSTRRGRPGNSVGKHPDTGTPELRQKRRYHLTAEPLDLLRDRRCISPAEHRAGIHFRWLYTLCHGVPLPVTPCLGESARGEARRGDAPCWREEREAEYREVSAALRRSHRLNGVLNCCVFQETPGNRQEMEHLREGLEQLAARWHKKQAVEKKCRLG